MCFRQLVGGYRLQNILNIPTCVRMMLELGADPNLVDDTNRAPVHWAAMMTNSDPLKILVEHGGDVNLQADPKVTGVTLPAPLTPLTTAAYAYKNLYLLYSIRYSFEAPNTWMPTQAQEHRDRATTLSFKRNYVNKKSPDWFLVEQKAKLTPKGEKMTVFKDLVAANKVELVRFITETYPAADVPLDVGSWKGADPISYAATHRMRDMVQVLDNYKPQWKASKGGCWLFKWTC